MKKLILFSLIVAFLSACSVSSPLLVTDNPVGQKVGESSYTMFLGFPPFNGDAGIASAAKNGGISKIATVDRKIKSGFLTVKVITIVTGE